MYVNTETVELIYYMMMNNWLANRRHHNDKNTKAQMFYLITMLT